VGNGVTRSGLLAELAAAVDCAEPVVLATVVATRRSVPRHAGTKMLVYADGRQSGTIGGGEMEARVLAEALDALADGRTRLLDFSLVNPSAGDPGVCGGDVSIYLEPYMPPATVYIIGCGHVGKAVADLAHWLGYRVIAADDRVELATPELVPNADEVIAGPIADALAQAPITADTHVVLVTRNVPFDLEILPTLLASPARSIGVMGSERRWATTQRQLAEQGVSEAALAQVIAPIGVEIGAETPEEIAVSILAQITALRRTAPGGPTAT
jgi:xanthine dehydrogenase accessory factor